MVVVRGGFDKSKQSREGLGELWLWCQSMCLQFWLLQHRTLLPCWPLLLPQDDSLIPLPFQFDSLALEWKWSSPFYEGFGFTCAAARCFSSTSANICLCKAFCLKASSCFAWLPVCPEFWFLEAATAGWGSKADEGDEPSNLCPWWLCWVATWVTGLGNRVTEAPFDPNPMSRLKSSCLSYVPILTAIPVYLRIAGGRM